MKKDYLIIDRAKWRTGGHSYENRTGLGITELLNSNGFMCCLGFRCHQMGILEKDLLYTSLPSGLSENWDIPDLIDPYGNTEFTTTAALINDNYDITSKEREKRITKHFATIGVTVEFKGKYVKP
jgi:hypothetical protein